MNTRSICAYRVLLVSALASCSLVGEARAQEGQLRGLVFDGDSGQPVARATVRVLDAEFRVVDSTTSDREGRFVISGPVLEGLVLVVEAPGYLTSSPLAVALSGESGVQVLVELSALESTSTSASDAAPNAVLGRVRDALTGQPVPEATVTLGDTYQDIVGPSGVFEFDQVPVGTHHLRVERLGYETLETTVRTEGGAGSFLEISLGVEPIPLAPVEVFAIPRSGALDMQDLRHRIRLGHGDFITGDEITARGSPEMLMLLNSLPSVTLFRGRIPVFRNARSILREVCPPTYYVDGAKMRSVEDVQRLVTMDVELIEGYPGAATVPGEYAGSDARCGVIAIWTRRGARIPLSALIAKWKLGG